MSNTHGSKWIRPEKRRRIYARDGWCCAYCGTVEALSLDHLRPREWGGSNQATNLITSCVSCNSKRKLTSLLEFCGEKTAKKIRRMVRRKLPSEYDCAEQLSFAC